MFDRKFGMNNVVMEQNQQQTEQQENYDIMVNAKTSFKVDEKNGAIAKPLFVEDKITGEVKLKLRVKLGADEYQLQGDALKIQKNINVGDGVLNDILKSNKEAIGNNTSDVKGRLGFMSYLVEQYPELKKMDKQGKENFVGEKVRDILKDYYSQIKEFKNKSIERIEEILAKYDKKEGYTIMPISGGKSVAINEKTMGSVLAGSYFSFTFEGLFKKVLLKDSIKDNEEAKKEIKDMEKRGEITNKKMADFFAFLNKIDIKKEYKKNDEIIVPTIVADIRQNFDFSITIIKKTNDGLEKKEVISGLKNIITYLV